MCVWRFWLIISSGIKSRSIDLISWDILYIYIYMCVCVCVCVCVCIYIYIYMCVCVCSFITQSHLNGLLCSSNSCSPHKPVGAPVRKNRNMLWLGQRLKTLPISLNTPGGRSCSWIWLKSRISNPLRLIFRWVLVLELCCHVNTGRFSKCWASDQVVVKDL